MKISVVGMGRVGTATAFALVVRGIPHELVVVGRTREKVQGDAYDLLHASALVRPIRVRAGTADDTAGSDIILIALSTRADEGEVDRNKHAAANAKILRDVIPDLARLSPRAILVVMTNPLDLCTHVALRASGFDPGRVIGTGTLIDTMRFRSLLSREIGINAIDIRAYVLGEHGDTQFPAISTANAGGMRLEPGMQTIRALADEARRGGYEVARSKGYTNYAVALSATLICDAIATDARTVLPVSTWVDGPFGLKDVCLSLPCVVGRKGVERILEIDLDESETARLREAAETLRERIDRLDQPSP